MSSNRTLKLASLRPFQRGVTADFKIIKTQAVRTVQSRNDGSNHRVADVLIGDETGTMMLTLWDDNITKVEDGKVFRIVGGQTGLFQGCLQLSLGRAGKLESTTTTISEIKTANNLSLQSQSASKETKSRKKPTEKRNPPVKRTKGFKWSRIEPKSD